MSANEDGSQIEIADELAEVARSLAHATRTVPRPSDSYELLGVLQVAQQSLAQVYTHLATWHRDTVEGTHCNGTDGHSLYGVPATVAGASEQVTLLLKIAAASASETADLVGKAQAANGVVCWFDEVKETA
ncbi:hypothetical protein B7495_18590 (plasmid) [Cryobacterium sp. LW097]|uniref:hypothetical protein n=1 Tax=unclassified Cryobacterium TaxID=2649013 RepID=UPI000B4DAAFA|nr:MULTISPECIES: hypothetical protein [unclassified Cryobacterium]ASD24161.1 hypothetical protein B7495_17855 [Cryobacterium sp. LW097]ASD24282.1 hypothetical protein B7495_18590 [Cryobacterium sp. LW097]TFC52854.1 hypothetical protein E3O68_13240 [Cryobacterium sp. TMB3-1-2]TFC62205.1 hypothetical protein E3O60_02650 [Cryobacterium sp. TMB1-7]TFC70704.1 hypothetical protein E3T21_09855 [Cryobacterium sp. TMB3-15]